MSGGCKLVSDARHLDAAVFQDRVRRVANGLLGMGLPEGACVALLLRNDFAFLEASLGAQKAGLYPVPINWHLKPAEISYILDDCGARLLIAHADLLAQISDDLPPGLPVLSVGMPDEIAAAYRLPQPPPSDYMRWDDWLAAQKAVAPEAGPKVAIARESVIYTSGTTGRPKAVLRRLADAGQSARIEAMRRATYGFQPGMRTILTAPMYPSAPNSYAVRAVQQGELAVLMPRFEPEAFLQLVQRHRATHLFMVPTMFIRLLKLPEPIRAQYDVSSLQFIIHAGSPCPPDVKQAMIAWVGPIVHEFYGCTESGSVTLCDSAEALVRPGTVGRAIDGARLAVLAADGHPVPSGTVGEIYMRIGFYPDFTYLGRDDLRKEVEQDGMITGGDLGYLDNEGYLFICDRKRDMVIVGGVNVYPAEIEAVLAGMPGVRDSAVFGIPHPEYGEALMAVVQPLEEHSISADDVQAFLAARLATYKVPRSIELRAELPREDSGKIFKRRLRDPYWESAGRMV